MKTLKTLLVTVLAATALNATAKGEWTKEVLFPENTTGFWNDDLRVAMPDANTNTATHFSFE